MKKLFTISVLCFLLITLNLQGQFAGSPQMAEPGYPYFETKVFSSFDENTGKPVARIYVQIDNSSLTFIKADSGYVADVQIEIILKKKGKDFVFNRSLNKQVFVREYASTTSPEIINTFSNDVPVEAGEYEASIFVRDKNSNKQVNRKTRFKVNRSDHIQEGFALSGLLLSNEFKFDSTGKVVKFSPNLSNSFTSDGKFLLVHFNTYTYDPGDTLLIEYFVRDDRGIIVQHNQYLSHAAERLVKHYIRLNRYYFNRHQYSLEVKVTLGNVQQTSSDQFQFYWRYAPTSVEDLNLALRQLRYIGDMDSIKFYLKAPYTERKEYFFRFWKSQDPNPDTPENELMSEYYRRVNFTNKNFSITGEDGWLTDRGRIYIKFGQPDDIERHPFESGSYPFEIWRYYTLRKTFLFIDRTGFGDYVLHPSYYFVEYE